VGLVRPLSDDRIGRWQWKYDSGDASGTAPAVAWELRSLASKWCKGSNLQRALEELADMINTLP